MRGLWPLRRLYMQQHTRFDVLHSSVSTYTCFGVIFIFSRSMFVQLTKKGNHWTHITFQRRMLQILNLVYQMVTAILLYIRTPTIWGNTMWHYAIVEILSIHKYNITWFYFNLKHVLCMWHTGMKIAPQSQPVGHWWLSHSLDESPYWNQTYCSYQI